MPIRWRLTLFIALAIGAILLVLGVALFFLLREALLFERRGTPPEKGPCRLPHTIEEDDSLEQEDVSEYTLDGVFVIVRDGKGDVLYPETVNLPSGGAAKDPVWQEALNTGEPASDTVEFSGDEPEYIYAVPVNPTRGTARVVEAGKSYEEAYEGVRDVGVILAAGIGVAFLLSIGGAYLLARAALRPVEAVTATAQEMGEGDLAKRLPVANPKDEIGRLATYHKRPAGASRGRLQAQGGGPLAPAALRRRREPRAENPPDLHKRARQDARRVGPRRRQGDRASERRHHPQGGREDARPDRVPTHADPRGRGRAHGGGALRPRCGREGGDRDRQSNGKVSVEFVPTEHEITATFDRERVLQVASILLDNAVKYTPSGGSVAVGVEEYDGGVALAVSDTGVGISEDQLPLVFERFYRADAARSEEGVGLGLSIARQIAEAHGGTIAARSKPGVGSTFVLLLPRQKPDPPQGPRTKEAEDPR